MAKTKASFPVLSEYSIPAPIQKRLRFAFVSDLHDCDNAPILEKIAAQKIDAILIGGDFVHNTQRFQRGIDFLHLAAKTATTFCAIGNHEKKCRRDLYPLIRESGVVLLDNAAVPFQGIQIGGLTTGFLKGQKQSKLQKTPPPKLSFLEEFSRLEGFKLLLCHHPEYYKRYVRPLPIDLTLSGHAHGGQWRFFGRGVFAPGQGIFPKYTSGLYENRLLVGRGLGDGHSVPRIFNAPEIILLHLVPQMKEQFR